MSFPIMNPNVSLTQITPGPQSGEIWVPGIRELQRVTDWTEGIIYDSMLLPATITAGQTISFFQSLMIAGIPKTNSQSNMQTPSQLPSRWRMVVNGIHIQPAIGTPVDDILALFESGYFRFQTGGAKTEKEGPLWTFPSPYGITGIHSIDGHAAPREVSMINNGVPSPAAMGLMQLPIDLADEQIFVGEMSWDALTTLTAAMMVWVILRGYIQKPVM